LALSTKSAASFRASWRGARFGDRPHRWRQRV